MKPKNAIEDKEQATKRLEALQDDEWWGLVSVRFDSEGVLEYFNRGPTRVGRVPALEIPHEDPHFVDEPETPFTPPNFDDKMAEYGCDYRIVEGHTYVFADETRTPTDLDEDQDGFEVTR